MHRKLTPVAATLATFAAGLLMGCDASGPADRRAAALDQAIPPALQRASVPGAIVGICRTAARPT